MHPTKALFSTISALKLISRRLTSWQHAPPEERSQHPLPAGGGRFIFPPPVLLFYARVKNKRMCELNYANSIGSRLVLETTLDSAAQAKSQLLSRCDLVFDPNK